MDYWFLVKLIIPRRVRSESQGAPFHAGKLVPRDSLIPARSPPPRVFFRSLPRRHFSPTRVVTKETETLPQHHPGITQSRLPIITTYPKPRRTLVLAGARVPENSQTPPFHCYKTEPPSLHQSQRCRQPPSRLSPILVLVGGSLSPPRHSLIESLLRHVPRRVPSPSHPPSTSLLSPSRPSPLESLPRHVPRQATSLTSPVESLRRHLPRPNHFPITPIPASPSLTAMNHQPLQ